KQQVDLQGVMEMQHLPALATLFVAEEQLPNDIFMQANWFLLGSWRDAIINWQIDNAGLQDLNGFSIAGLQSNGWAQINARAWNIKASADSFNDIYSEDSNINMRHIMLTSQYQNDIIELDLAAQTAAHKQNLLLAATAKKLADEKNWQGNIKRLHIPQIIDVQGLNWSWFYEQDKKWRLHIAKQIIKIIYPITNTSKNIPINIAFDGDLTTGEMSVYMPAVAINNFIQIDDDKTAITAKILLNGPWSQPKLHAQANTTPIDLGVNLGVAKIKLDYADNKFKWRAQLGEDIYSFGVLPVDWQLLPFVWQVQTGLQARLDANVSDLKQFKIWLPDINPLQGKLKLITKASDIILPLRIDSNMSVNISNFGVPALGLDMYANVVA
ncbi:MAG: hypothetical protein R8L53_09340, partial [Mariprofundales bacterium]